MGVATQLLCRAKFTVGRSMFRLGWKTASLEWFEAALSTSPDSVDPRHWRAFALSESERHEDALVEYRVVVNHVPDDPVALGGLAYSLQALGRLENLEP